ncbi:hypothetical protein TNCV_4477641 [Trichonephila clavipes]|nr:hypothetical protein TNCV_4477641 [Trichonephila clavipes]
MMSPVEFLKRTTPRGYVSRSLVHMLPAMMANYQQQGPNNNVIQQVTPPLITNDGHQPPVIQQHEDICEAVANGGSQTILRGARLLD